MRSDETITPFGSSAMAVMVIGEIWFTIRAFLHSNFNNVKGFQFFFFFCSPVFAHFECHYRLHGRTHAKKKRKSARQFRCWSKCIDKIFKCHTMAAIRSDNDNNKFNGVMECIDSAQCVHRPSSERWRRLSMHFTFTFYVVPCSWFNGKMVFALMRMNKWTIVKPQIRSDVRVHSFSVFALAFGCIFSCFCFHFELHSFIFDLALENSLQHFHANFDANHCRWR